MRLLVEVDLYQAAHEKDDFDGGSKEAVEGKGRRSKAA